MAQHGRSLDEATGGSKSTHSDARRSRPRRGRRILLSTLAGVLVLAMIATAFLTWSVVRAFPQTEGSIEVDGLQSEVTVHRDSHGIPTLTAETSEDLFRAQGFVHAQDRFWEMDFRRHMTSGRLSELFGEAQVETDSFLRTLGWHRVAQEEVDALPEEVLGYYEAYADGVNAYLDERQGGALAFEYTVLGLQNPDYEPEPWTPTDSVAWLKAMAWDLRTNIEDETSRALLEPDLEPDRLTELYPAYPFDEHPVIMAEDPDGSTPAQADIPAPATAEGPADDADADAADAETTDADSAETAPADTAPDSAEPSAASDALASLDFDSSALSDLLTRVDSLVGGAGEGIGSNSWVVSGEHTETGEPLLANDPHLGASLPSVWSQMQLRCAEVTEECPFAVAGYSFSGLPGIVIGHNQQIAWGFTNLTTDVADLYVERLTEDGYERDGETVPFETRQETIRVAGGDDVDLEVRSTGHGPIVSGLTPEFTSIVNTPSDNATAAADDTADEVSGDSALPDGDYAVSLRWTALDAGSTAQAIFSLNLAEDFSEFRQAASQFDVPAQSLIYADTEGNIGYQAPGRLPIRGEGDGWLPQPGWDSAYDWQGFIPFEEQPVVYNPDSGYIATANNAIVNDDYPYFLSRDWDYGHRGARIVELLESRIDAGDVTAQDMAAIHMDNEFPAADSLRSAYQSITVEDEDVQQALELLRDWDGQNDADSAAAAYANVLWDQVTAAMTSTQGAQISRDDQSRLAVFLADQLADEDSAWWGGSRVGLLQTAAQQAHAELVELQGENPEEWNWGQLHELSLTHGSFGESGIAPIEALFNRGPYETGGGSGVVNATGWEMDEGYATTTVPSMRMVIDVGSWDASTWQNLTGQSGHAFHPHYTDQAEGWTSGEQYPWAYSPEAVEQAAEDTLTLMPGSP